MADFHTQQRPGEGTGQTPNGDGLKESATRVGEYVTEQARMGTNEAGRLANETVKSARDNPYTTIAIAAGLAFALGALWKMRSSRQQSNLDALMSRMPDMPSRNNLWPRAWR